MSTTKAFAYPVHKRVMLAARLDEAEYGEQNDGTEDGTSRSSNDLEHGRIG